MQCPNSWHTFFLRLVIWKVKKNKKKSKREALGPGRGCWPRPRPDEGLRAGIPILSFHVSPLTETSAGPSALLSPPAGSRSDASPFSFSVLKLFSDKKRVETALEQCGLVNNRVTAEPLGRPS